MRAPSEEVSLLTLGDLLAQSEARSRPLLPCLAAVARGAVAAARLNADVHGQSFGTNSTYGATDEQQQQRRRETLGELHSSCVPSLCWVPSPSEPSGGVPSPCVPSLGSGSRPASVHVRSAPTPVPYGASPELAGTHTSTPPPPQPPRRPVGYLDPSCAHVPPPPPPPPPPPLPAHLLSGLAEHDSTATARPVVTVTTPASAASSTVAAAMMPKAAAEGPSSLWAPSEVPGVGTSPTSNVPAPLALAGSVVVGSVVVGSAASGGAASVGAMDSWDAATRRREGSVGAGRISSSASTSSFSTTSFSAAACAAAFSAASFVALASASESAMPSKAASPSATPPRAVSPTSHAEHAAQHSASAGSDGAQILQSWTRGVGASPAPPPPPATIASTAVPIAPSATVAAALMTAPSVAAVLLRGPDPSRKTAFVTAYTSPAPLATPSLVPPPPTAPRASIALPSAVPSVRRASTHERCVEQPPLSAARASPLNTTLNPPPAPSAASPVYVHGAAAAQHNASPVYVHGAAAAQHNAGAAAPSGEQKGRWEGETWVPGEWVHERGTPLAPPEPAAGAVAGGAVAGGAVGPASSLSAMGAAHYAWAHVGSAGAGAADEIDPAMEMAAEMVAVQTMLSRMAAARTQSHAASPSVASLAPEEGADGAADGAAAVAAVGQAAVAGGLPTQEEYTNPCNDLLPQRRGGAASTVKASHGLAAQGKLTNPNAHRPATAAPDAPPPPATAAGASAVAAAGTQSATMVTPGAIAAAPSAVAGACEAGESWQIAAFGGTAATVLPVPAVGYTRMIARPRTYVAASELRHAATRPDGQMVPWGGAVQGANVRALPPPRYLELRAHQAKGAVGAGGEERRRQPGACAFRSTRRSRSLQRSEEEGEARHLPPDRPTRLSRLRERHKKETLETAPLEPFVGRTARADFYSVGWLE